MRALIAGLLLAALAGTAAMAQTNPDGSAYTGAQPYGDPTPPPEWNPSPSGPSHNITTWNPPPDPAPGHNITTWNPPPDPAPGHNITTGPVFMPQPMSGPSPSDVGQAWGRAAEANQYYYNQLGQDVAGFGVLVGALIERHKQRQAAEREAGIRAEARAYAVARAKVVLDMIGQNKCSEAKTYAYGTGDMEFAARVGALCPDGAQTYFRFTPNYVRFASGGAP